MSQDINLSKDQRVEAVTALVDALRAAQTASDVMDEAFCDFMGINRTDGRCLEVLDRQGALTAGELAREVGLSTGAVTAMTDRLEASSLVHRKAAPLDRRKVMIELTPHAQTLTSEVWGEMLHATAPHIDALADRDLLTLISFFDVSRRVNLELADTIRARTSGRKTSLRSRLLQARAIRDDAKSLLKSMKSEMKDWIEVTIVSGDTTWVRDENGNWTQRNPP